MLPQSSVGPRSEKALSILATGVRAISRIAQEDACNGVIASKLGQGLPGSWVFAREANPANACIFPNLSMVAGRVNLSGCGDCRLPLQRKAENLRKVYGCAALV